MHSARNFMLLRRTLGALKRWQGLGRAGHAGAQGRALASDQAKFLRAVEFAKRFPAPQGPVAQGRDATSQNALRDYFDAHREGPGTWKFWHYFDLYHRHLAKFIGREVHIAEIGVFSGGSLPMWHAYFGANCHVYGVDIQEACRAYEAERTKILIGDQADRGFWKRFREAVPHLDIVIDDGGHTAEQQIVSCEELLGHLRPGGVYICEDVVGLHNGFSAFAHGLAESLNVVAWPAGQTEASPEYLTPTTNFQAVVDSVHTYPLAVVVERRERAAGSLVAPKHGSEWNPPGWLR